MSFSIPEPEILQLDYPYNGVSIVCSFNLLKLRHFLVLFFNRKEELHDFCFSLEDLSFKARTENSNISLNTYIL